MRPYSGVVSAKNVLTTDLGPIGSLDSPVIKQIAQLNNPYSGVFSTSCPTVSFSIRFSPNSAIFNLNLSKFVEVVLNLFMKLQTSTISNLVNLGIKLEII